MNPTHAYRHVLAGRNLEGTLLVLSACDFENRAARPVAVRERFGIRAIFDSNAHPLESAREDDLFNSPSRQVTRCEVFARGGDLNFFRAHHGDDFMLARSM